MSARLNCTRFRAASNHIEISITYEFAVLFWVARQRELKRRCMHHRFPLYKVSLTYDATRGRWIQEKHTTGKRIELLRSSEVMSNLSAVSQKFDDMREAIEHFNPLRARRVKSD